MDNRIVYIAEAFANDLKYVQLHSVGTDKDSINAIAAELQAELEEEIKDFSEFGIVHGMVVDNLSNLKSHIEFGVDWEALNNSEIDIDTFHSEIKRRGLVYIVELENSALPPEMKHAYISFWKGEIVFRNEKKGMMITTNVPRLGD